MSPRGRERVSSLGSPFTRTRSRAPPWTSFDLHYSLVPNAAPWGLELHHMNPGARVGGRGDISQLIGGQKQQWRHVTQLQGSVCLWVKVPESDGAFPFSDCPPTRCLSFFIRKARLYTFLVGLLREHNENISLKCLTQGLAQRSCWYY